MLGRQELTVLIQEPSDRGSGLRRKDWLEVEVKAVYALWPRSMAALKAS